MANRNTGAPAPQPLTHLEMATLYPKAWAAWTRNGPAQPALDRFLVEYDTLVGERFGWNGESEMARAWDFAINRWVDVEVES